jgi:hypothetical protein
VKTQTKLDTIQRRPLHVNKIISLIVTALVALIATNARAQAPEATPAQGKAAATDESTSAPERHHPLKKAEPDNKSSEANQADRSASESANDNKDASKDNSDDNTDNDDREMRNERREARKIARRNSHRDERKGFVIDAQLFGLTAPRTLALVSGLTVGTYLNEHLLLSADYTYANSTEDSIDSRHASVRSFGIHARYFLGHSFNLKTGVDYRDINATSYYYSSDPRLSTSRQDAGVDLSIGNLWTFGSGFMLGADWVTYIQPLWSHESAINGSPEDLEGANYEFAKLILGFNF